MKIFEIPEKVKVEWNDEVKSVVAVWSTYSLTDEEFKELASKSISYARLHFGQAWIVDSSEANGLLKTEQLNLLNNRIFAKLSEIGIKYLITIKPDSSAFTEFTVMKYSAMAGPNGLQLINVNSIEQAVLWLKSQN